MANDERVGGVLAWRIGDAGVNRCVVTIACGERYVPLAGRLLQSFHATGDTSPVMAWVNSYPLGAPEGLELPARAYCAKPFALKAAWKQGFELLLWLDSACYLVKPLHKLWEFIDREGHYCQDNGWKMGQWCSDAALNTLKIDRETALNVPEISTMAFGLDMRKTDSQRFLEDWCRLAADGVTFPGAHTNDVGGAVAAGVAYRNVGHVSDDSRVWGHRHDQSAATGLAYRFGWQNVPRPIYADYWKETQDARTLVVNRGGM